MRFVQPPDGPSRFEVSVEEWSLQFTIPSDPALISQVSDAVRKFLADKSIVDDNVVLEIITALEESLANAIVHGNLELASEKRRDPVAFQQFIEERRSHQPYCDRAVSLRVHVSMEQVELIVRDQGLGFDPDRIPDPRSSSNTATPWGNGLLIIRSFMDQVRHNDRGNEITMVRRLANTVP